VQSPVSLGEASRTVSRPRVTTWTHRARVGVLRRVVGRPVAMCLGDLIADRYRLLRRLDRPSVERVWEARDEVSTDLVSVRLLHPPPGLDVSTAERFREDARLATKLSHPHVVPVREIGVDGRRTYVVADLWEGTSLAEVLASRSPLPVEEAMSCAVQVCDALAAAHASGLVHRRLHPGQIVVDPGDVVRVGGFGLPLLHHDADEGPSALEAGYQAPEQATEPTLADARTDLYALGCVVAALFTGHPPFDDQDAEEVREQHRQQRPPLLRALRPDVPEPVDSLVGDLLAKNPADRPSAALEVGFRLRGGVAPHAAHVPGHAEHDAARAELAAAPTRRVSALLPVYAVVALGMIATALYFVGTHSG
jgi:eukaryotic-like serine/threonine-protein kinase